LKNLSQVLDKQSTRYINISVAVALMFFLILEDRFVNQSIPSIMPFLENYFSLSVTEVGLYFSLFMMGSLLFTFISGRLIDILGARKMLLFSLAVMSIFIIMQSFAQNYYHILGAGFVIGSLHSIILPSVSKNVRSIVPIQTRATYQGIIMTGFDLGGALAGLILPFVAIISFSWRNSLLFTALLPIIAVMAVFYSKDLWKQQTTQTVDAFGQTIKSLLRLKGVPYIAVNAFCVGGITAGTMTHFTLFVYKSYNVSPEFAGFLMAFIFFGGIPGRIIIGLICDRYYRYERKKMMTMITILAFVMYVILVIAIIQAIPVTYLNVIAFLIGVAIFGGNPLQVILVTEMVGENLAGTAMAIILSIPFIVGKIFAPLLFGILIDSTGGQYWVGWMFLGLLSLLASLSCYGIPTTLELQKNIFKT